MDLSDAHPFLSRRLTAALGLALALGSLTTAAADPVPPEWRVRGEWRAHANADDVRAILSDPDGSIWTASASGGVAHWSPDRSALTQFLAPVDGLPCNDVRDVLRWRGRVWVATCDGLAIHVPGAERMERVTADLPSNSLTALAIDADDRLWVGSRPVWDPLARVTGKSDPGGWVGGGVASSSDGISWVQHGLAAGLPSAKITDLAAWRGGLYVSTAPYLDWAPPTEDPDGLPVPGRWVAVGGGLARLDAGTWLSWASETVPELSDDIQALAAGSDALWVATSGRGLVAFDGARWHALRDCGDDTQCIPENFVTAVAVGEDGAVWVAVRRFNGQGAGVSVLDHKGTLRDSSDDAWWPLRGESEPPGSLIHAILPTDDARVWFGSSEMDPAGAVHGRGLGELLGDRRTMVGHRSANVGLGAPIDNDITAIATNPATGELWIGTARDGLSIRGVDGRWRHVRRDTPGGGPASDGIADIAVEPSGTVWVATRQMRYDATMRQWLDGGLSRFDSTGWTHLSESDGLPASHISALALDGRGTLWVGTGDTDRGSKEHAYRGWGLAAVNTATRRWERTYSFPQLVSNNVTDLVVVGGKLYVATAYYFYVDPRPGGAQFSTGGGVSILNLDTGTWSSITDENGLSVAIRSRTSGSGRALIDTRSLLVDESGTLRVGALSFPDATFDPNFPPDGVLDTVDGDVVRTERFVGAGAVTAVARDAGGALWAATVRDGLWVQPPDGGWLRGPGGWAPTTVVALEFDDEGGWVGTAGEGLARLEPPVPPTATPDGSATAAPPSASTPQPFIFIFRAENKIYIPTVKNEFTPHLLVGPSGPR